jgi:hypothetical protein
LPEARSQKQVARSQKQAARSKNMKGTLFLKAVRHLLDPIDKKAPRKTWDIAFCTLKGKKVTGKVACTSSNFENDTFNFKFIESNEIRTAHAQLLLSVNGKEVML